MKKHPVLGGTLVAFGICFGGCAFISMMGDESSSSSKQTKSTVPLVTAEITVEPMNKTGDSDFGKGRVSMDHYNRIENGMSYNDVVKIIGFDGELFSESQFDDIITSLYYWYNEDGVTNISVIVQNDEVVSKSEFGLK